MKPFSLLIPLVVLLNLTNLTPANGQISVTLHAPYSTYYSLVDLGSVPDLPTPYGGMTFKADDPNTLLIAGAANTANGQLFAVTVVRDASGHITGFTGTARLFAEAPYNDGGVAYGPGGVLFLSRYPNNEIGEIRSGELVAGKVVNLPPNVTGSPGGLNFVPPGWPNENRLLFCGYPDGKFYSAGLKGDEFGTYGVTNVALETQISGSPEGFIFVPPGSQLFSNYNAMLVCNYSAGEIDAFRLSANSAPQPLTKSVFISGLTGAEGAVIDPISRDFMFSTFGGGDHLIAVRGFNQPPVVSVTTPTNNATQRCCLPSSLTVVASDDSQAKRVELFVDGARIAESVSSPLVAAWETNRPGAYTLTARATDDGGVVSTSSPVTLNIVAPALNTILTAGFNAQRSFRLCGNGETNGDYFMEGATNWSNWTNLGPMVRTNGILEFSDIGASNQTFRFYRMRH